MSNPQSLNERGAAAEDLEESLVWSPGFRVLGFGGLWGLGGFWGLRGLGV